MQLRFPHNNMAALEKLLQDGHEGAKLRYPVVIATDGINSITGNAPPTCEMARLARKYSALLYIDDAHGKNPISRLDATGMRCLLD